MQVNKTKLKKSSLSRVFLRDLHGKETYKLKGSIPVKQIFCTGYLLF